MKKFIAILLCAVVISSVSVYAYANETEENFEDEIVLEYAHVLDSTTTFSITSSGIATVRNSYTGKSANFSKAIITTKIQKKVGIVWVTVSGGSWTDTSTSVTYSKSHSIQLSSKGTYRANVTFVISGSSGSDDKITKTVQKTYS